MGSVDHRATVARRKLGDLPSTFEFYEWRCMEDPDGTVMIKGAEVLGVIARGRGKGRKRWGEPKFALVTDAEMLAERRRYEREEGKCAECGGDGQAFASWDHREGIKYRPCVKCQATGKPLTLAAVDPVGEDAARTSTRV